MAAKQFVLDKFSSNGWKLLEQIVIWAHDLESAKIKAKQLHGSEFIFMAV